MADAIVEANQGEDFVSQKQALKKMLNLKPGNTSEEVVEEVTEECGCSSQDRK